MASMDRRNLLLELFQAALDSVSGRPAVRSFLAAHPIDYRPHVVAVGKAACAMASGALDVLDEQVGDVLIITKLGHLEDICTRAGVRCYESQHPVPDASSLRAGQRLVDFVKERPAGPFLFLISGGASSLVEVLPDKVGLDQLDELTNWLLASGNPIQEMNRHRRALSCIKGGKLLTHLDPKAHVKVLLISDVMGDDLEAIGSGLCYPIHDEIVPSTLPETIQAWWQACSVRAPERRPEHHIVASLKQAMQAVQVSAVEKGFPVHLHEQLLTGDAAWEGRRLAEALIDELPDGIHIWGGETTVQLPTSPGRGGRNQHLALSAAEVLAGVKGISLLSAGTDGTDGPGTDAGALVDGGTIQRGTDNGLNARASLEQADSGCFLEETGDLISTGPTGTNVMDLVIAIKS